MSHPLDFHTFLAGLDPAKAQEIERASEILRIPAGGVIYRQDDKADALYVVESGVVEIILENRHEQRHRTLAYLRKGEIFGELGVLTDHVRTATVKTCEASVLRRINATKFVSLLRKTPTLGECVAQQMAARFYTITSAQYVQSYCVDFGGDMMSFDLLLVFQTIVFSGRDGELRLTTPNNDLVGSFFIRNATVEFARFAHLQGIEAVWQVFLAEKMEGRFEFQIMTEPQLQFDADHRITLEGTDLLMQAAAKRDTYQSFAESSRNLERRLSRVAEELSWADADTKPAAEMIWKCITKRPQPLSTIWRLSNLSIMSLIQTTRKMRDLGLATLQ